MEMLDGLDSGLLDDSVDIADTKPVSAAQWLRMGLVLVILVAAARLTMRVGYDATHLSADFRSLYLGSVAMNHGENPYEPAGLEHAWELKRGSQDATVSEMFDKTPQGVPKLWIDTPPVYPPSSMVVVAPLAMLSFPAARMIWLALNLLLTAMAWMAASDLAGLRIGDWRSLLLAAVWLQLGPFVTCVRLGNPAAQTISLAILSLWCLKNNRVTLGAVVLGLITALKPQIGAAFIVYLMADRRWRASIIALSVLAVISLIGFIQLRHLPWLASLRANLAFASTNGQCNDPTAANPNRWQLVNLQYPLHTLLSSDLAVSVITCLLTLALSLLYVKLLRSTTLDRPELLAAAGPALLCLLPLYHRYYDTLVLVIPIAWALGSLLNAGRARYWAIAVLAATLPFYVSWPFVLNNLALAGHIPSRIVHAWWFNSLVMPIQIWTLLGMLAVLMICLTQFNGNEAETAEAV